MREPGAWAPAPAWTWGRKRNWEGDAGLAPCGALGRGSRWRVPGRGPGWQDREGAGALFRGDSNSGSCHLRLLSRRAPALLPRPLLTQGHCRPGWSCRGVREKSEGGAPAQASVGLGACRCPERTARGDSGWRQGRADRDGDRDRARPPRGPSPPSSTHRNADPHARIPQGPPSLPPDPCLKQASAQRLSKLVHWPPSGRAGLGWGWGRGGGRDLSPAPCAA